MALSVSHPEYRTFSPYWQKLKDCYDGEDIIKSKRTLYLPPTRSMQNDGMDVNQPGYQDYQAYLTRTRFPGDVANSIRIFLSLIHQKRASFNIPGLAELEDNATRDGQSLTAVLRKINFYQLLYGRCFIMADFDNIQQRGDIPIYLHVYPAPNVINWGEDFVIIEEHVYERSIDFSWTPVTRYKVLELRDGVYQFGNFTNRSQFNPTDMQVAMWNGNTSSEIPGVFVNTDDTDLCPDVPPLLDLANLSLTIYRGEADYRQNLYLQTQAMLVVSGARIGKDGDKDGNNQRVNAGYMLELANPLDKAYFIKPGSDGIDAQKEALANDKSEASQIGGQLISNMQRVSESGTALSIRVNASTTNIHTINLTGGDALLELLKIVGRWRGLSESQIDSFEVNVNEDYAYDMLEMKDFVELKRYGFEVPLDDEVRFYQKLNFTNKTADEWKQAITADRNEGFGNPINQINQTEQE